jgi:hypothetical protein
MSVYECEGVISHSAICGGLGTDGPVLEVGSKNVVSFLVKRGCFGLENPHVSIQANQ